MHLNSPSKVADLVQSYPGIRLYALPVELPVQRAKRTRSFTTKREEAVCSSQDLGAL